MQRCVGLEFVFCKFDINCLLSDVEMQQETKINSVEQEKGLAADK